MAGSERKAASTSEMGRFETETLTEEKNLKGLARMNSQWVEGAMVHTPHRRVILDMDSFESPVHGQQEGAAYNGHFECVCYHPLFLFNQFGDCEAAKLRSGNVHSADDWQEVLDPVVERYLIAAVRLLFRADALCQAGDIRIPGSEKHRLCYQAAVQSGVAAGDSALAGTACGVAFPRSPSSPIMTSSTRPRVGMYPEECWPRWSSTRESCSPEWAS